MINLRPLDQDVFAQRLTRGFDFAAMRQVAEKFVEQTAADLEEAESIGDTELATVLRGRLENARGALAQADDALVALVAGEQDLRDAQGRLVRAHVALAAGAPDDKTATLQWAEYHRALSGEACHANRQSALRAAVTAPLTRAAKLANDDVSRARAAVAKETAGLLGMYCDAYARASDSYYSVDECNSAALRQGREATSNHVAWWKLCESRALAEHRAAVKKQRKGDRDLPSIEEVEQLFARRRQGRDLARRDAASAIARMQGGLA